MTNQEAKNELFNLIEDGVVNKSNIALKLAIQALESLPCDDCISREAAIKKLKALSWTNYDLDDAAEVLKILPSVQPQRHKGKWKAFDTTFGRNIYYCTACGRSIEILYEYDFCPLCGADMREREG